MTVTRTAAVTVKSTPLQVWDMVTDITRMGEWSPENERGEWLDGHTGAKVGARFKGYNRRGKTKWSTTCEVIEADPGRSFSFAVGGAAKPDTVWRYRFEPVTEGVEVTESFELPKPIGPFSRLLTRVTTGVKDRQADMEAGMHTTLQRLKAAAEAAANP